MQHSSVRRLVLTTVGATTRSFSKDHKGKGTTIKKHQEWVNDAAQNKGNAKTNQLSEVKHISNSQPFLYFPPSCMEKAHTWTDLASLWKPWSSMRRNTFRQSIHLSQVKRRVCSWSVERWSLSVPLMILESPWMMPCVSAHQWCQV